MWSLGVLMMVMLTGVSPPFAHYMAQSSGMGLCVEQLQQGITDCLHRALDACSTSSPICHSAQVCRVPPCASRCLLVCC